MSQPVAAAGNPDSSGGVPPASRLTARWGTEPEGMVLHTELVERPR